MYDEIYLRALTGRVVAKAAADLGINKLAVVAPKNILCSAMGAAIESAFVSYTGGISGHFERAPEGFDSVLLAFGGESPVEEMKRAFVEKLKDMAEREIESDVIIHVRTYGMGGLDMALEDETIAEYLTERATYVYTVDLEHGIFKMNEILWDEEYQLYPVLEYPLTLEHTRLLNKSLRGASLRWVEEPVEK
ncbi:MAG: hypothetical protein GXN92_02865 [Candidatus Micrarchaeota archaeon]|nr:hypothetical protein [Candidatus Micrarchaeota archaeon]